VPWTSATSAVEPSFTFLYPGCDSMSLSVPLKLSISSFRAHAYRQTRNRS